MGKNLKSAVVLMLILSAIGAPVVAGTLYRWSDQSGVVRFGYQPPPGVEAEIAEEERKEVYEQKEPIRCQALADEHVALIDREIARVKAIKAGLGSEFQMTPSAQQQLVMDLMAQRAAMITGRPASEFKSPSNDELLRSRNDLLTENSRLKNNAETLDQTIDAQSRQLAKRRRPKFFGPVVVSGPVGPWYPLGPGFYPGYAFPYSPMPPPPPH